ncbi:MAG TPA: tetratricopeptide repeat protein [Terriglobia bacterium]|nr:tetratricopeptide repeat protein [Terriglobia bacterium]
MDPSPAKLHHYVVRSLMALALFYAILAGLRTVADFDLGWQLATGRYVIQHKQIPYTDILSYTVRGKEWVYPPFSGVLLYAFYVLGGFAALSWLSAVACSATIALLLRRNSAITAALAVVSVPAISFATTTRAELFTTVLFAAFIAILWRQFQGERASLWLLPPLMLAWVNLHLGFIAGLAMMGAYVMLELLEMPFASRRSAALTRLRRTAPWLLATALVTLLNPWGPRIYVAIARQERSMLELGGFINHWLRPYVSFAAWREALTWHDPDSSYWWLVAAVIVAVLTSLWRRQFGVAVLLAGATYLSLAHLRYQGLFSCLAVTLGGTVLSGLALPEWSTRARRLIDTGLGRGSLGSQGLARLVLLGGMLLLVVIRCADLTWNRYYLFAGQVSLFGSGVSWWYPERAAAFLLRERLPRNIFNDYNLGGYLTWRIGPEYPDYVDGRLIPFGAPFLTHQRDLMQQSPESPEWQREADLRNINTILVSVARYGGLGSFPLQQFCASQAWRPVYLDEVAAIFVRSRPENAAWINRLQIDCATVHIDPPATVAMGSRARQNAELFNFYANAGSVLYVLGRGAEALRYLQSAQTIFPDDSNLHLTLGQLFQAYNRGDLAEQEYRASVQLRPTDMGWYLLGRLYVDHRHYEDAAQAFTHAAELSYQACDRYLELGELYVQMQRPQEALKAFARAVRLSPYPTSSPWGSSFYARVAAGRARAWLSQGDVDRAIEFQKQAVELTPLDPARLMQLAEMYQARGRADLAQQADQRAAELHSK